MARRPPAFDLLTAIADPGFTPAQGDLGALFDLLAKGPPEAREQAERALRRSGESVVAPAMARAKDAAPEAKSRLVALVGRLSGGAGDEAVNTFLLDALHDEHAAVRKRAAAGLSRGEGPQLEAALVEALAREQNDLARAAIVQALGKIGGAQAQAALETLGDSTDARTAAELRKARVRAARPAARSEASTVDTSHALAQPLRVWLDARRGMLPVLLEEAEAFRPRIEHRIDGCAVAAIDLRGPIDQLFAVRTWLSLSLPTAPVRRKANGDVVEAAVRALAEGGAAAAASALTRGPLRYRIAWAGGGKRRGDTFRLAEAVAATAPSLVNDPTDSVWELSLRETADQVAVEWRPTLDDPRFAYRSGDVPAASHPTIAAALAYLAGARRDDVVWDPFVGSGLELCERALRGPYARLVGSDIDPAALEIARLNLTACGVERADLMIQDAARRAPFGLRPTLVITNPPMGRRVHRSGDLREMLARVVTDIARALAPGGRFVWVSPFAADMRAAAERAGLTIRRAHVIDMGGFDAELQVWEK